MTTIGILTKPQFPEIATILLDLLKWLDHQEKSVLLGSQPAALLDQAPLHNNNRVASHADYIIVLGGDGTMLSAARLVEERSVPIIGINMGGLGFLTEATVDDLYPSLEKVFAQQFYLDHRLRLQASITHQNGTTEKASALNDIVISKGSVGRMIKVHMQLGEQFVTNLRGDGIIVSSPTGSTAYSLSAGGPILDPSLESLLVTPISPHTLTHRPLIVPGQVSLEIKLTSPDGAMASIDGQIDIAMECGDTITISTSPYRTRLIRFPDRTYYDVLRSKLKWGGGG